LIYFKVRLENVRVTTIRGNIPSLPHETN
jgi:hypothetical protein